MAWWWVLVGSGEAAGLCVNGEAVRWGQEGSEVRVAGKAKPGCSRGGQASSPVRLFNGMQWLWSGRMPTGVQLSTP